LEREKAEEALVKSSNKIKTKEVPLSRRRFSAIMDRRVFIKKTLAAGALIAGSGSLLNACGSGVKRTDLQPEGREFETVPALGDEASAILYYASLAPSGHNAQPWVVKVTSQREWIIGGDPKRRLPAVDPQNRELLLSIGAFVENLAIAASAMGYEAEMEVIGKTSADEDLVKISLKKGRQGNYPLKRLASRRTVKQGFRPDEIRSEDVKALSDPLKGRLFYYPRGSDHAKCIQEAALETLRLQTYRDEAQKELADWIRFSNEDARKYRDGLTTESMDIKGFAGWYVRNFMDRGDVTKESFRKQGVDLAAKQVEQGGGWFIVTSQGASVSDLIETGRKFERMALMAGEKKIGIHPMTQCLEEKQGLEKIASNHSAEVVPQFVLRVGYIDEYPGPVSLRRPLSWFVKA
jgi:nitroreductase